MGDGGGVHETPLARHHPSFPPMSARGQRARVYHLLGAAVSICSASPASLVAVLPNFPRGVMPVPTMRCVVVPHATHGPGPGSPGAAKTHKAL